MDRREFLVWSARLSLVSAFASPSAVGRGARDPSPAGPESDRPAAATGALSLFLAGDVMTGRGIDQVLPRSVAPRLYEPYVKDARTYVELAEEASGRIDPPLTYEQVWGAALGVLDEVRPHARVINLETAVTTADEPWEGKGIHYRMHPANAPLLTTAGIDVCALGNNHVMDWGRPGLRETLSVLTGHGLATPGAGRDLAAARAPATVDTAAGRLLVVSYGTRSAGVPSAWRAGPEEPSPSSRTCRRVVSTRSSST